MIVVITVIAILICLAACRPGLFNKIRRQSCLLSDAMPGPARRKSNVEADKLYKLLLNIDAYDGTGKGQIKL